MCNYWLLSWNVIQSFSNYSYISTAVWHPMVRPLRILNMEEWVHYFWLKREESQPGKNFSNTILQQKVAAIPILLCKDKEKKVNIWGKVNTRGEQCEKHKRIRGKKWGKICQLNILHHLKKIWHLTQQIIHYMMARKYYLRKICHLISFTNTRMSRTFAVPLSGQLPTIGQCPKIPN